MNEFYHSGVLGMKWGFRRYQNEDGSYKPGAEGRYYQGEYQNYDGNSNKYSFDTRNQNMSFKQKREFKRISKEIQENQIAQMKIDSQIQLIQSQKLLKDLKESQKYKGPIRRGAEWTGEFIKQSGQAAIMNVGTQYATMALESVVNNAINAHNQKKYGSSMYHSGIIGMHWYERNGPPYPLKKAVSKAIQRKGKADKAYQAKRAKLKKGDKRIKSEGISHESYKRDRELQTVGIHPSNYKGETNGEQEFGYYGPGGSWGRNPKFEFKGTYTKSDTSFNTISNELSKMSKEKGKALFGYSDTIGNGGTTNYTTFFDNNLEKVAQRVNGDRFKQIGYTNNCAKCSSAFEMQRRGYDVTAGGCHQGCLTSASEYWWDGAKTYKEKSNTIDDRIKKFGKNGSGTIGIKYASGGGHSFNFTTNRKTGVTSYVDSQTGKVIGHSWNDVTNFFSALDDNSFIRVTRLDTATPNFKHMAQDDVIDYSDGRYRQNGWERKIIDKKDIGANGGYRVYDRW